MFGGSGSQNAYMLVYRQKKIVKEQGYARPEVPDYQEKYIQNLNKEQEEYRVEYEKKKN